MTDDTEDDDALSATELKPKLLKRIRTEGVLAAFEAALQVLRDPKAAAPAKATMTTNIFRVAGYLKDEAEPAADPFSGMSGSELVAVVERLKREQRRMTEDLQKRRALRAGEDENAPTDLFA